MGDRITIAIDAMGGDFAPAAPVEGAVLAVKEFSDIKVLLVGKEDVLLGELKKHEYPKERIAVKNASEVIVTGEEPVKSIRGKKDSSLVVALRAVRDSEADALVTAGNTGSVLAGGQLIVKREQGVERSPIATAIPTEMGAALLVDAGANVDVRPNHLVGFAVMGQAYAEKVMRIEKPKVGLLNIGAEEEKGNALTKEAYRLLSEREDINFIGNVEGNEVSKGKADVIVADGFDGNLVLKMYEGVSATIMRSVKEVFMKNTKTKLGALLVKDALKEKLAAFDVEKYGGAPLLGLKALVVKGHGNSKGAAFKVAVGQCVDFIKADLNAVIKERMGNVNEE